MGLSTVMEEAQKITLDRFFFLKERPGPAGTNFENRAPKI